jgi:serine/threonine protein kinase/formylglycine-generating enzyme required for sulfatase activity/regulation of enolase protein 1 (concanavalin A-like superfamily)
MAAITSCPDSRVLERLALGEMSPLEVDQLAVHCEKCENCIQALQRIRRADTLVIALSSQGTMVQSANNPAIAALVARLKALGRLHSAVHEQATVAPSSLNTPLPKPPETFFDNSPTNLDFLGPPQSAGEIGRLGNFRILKVLGQGGMGVVLQAEDTRLGRLCALKVMLSEVARRPEMKERFLREARAAAQIEHDNIVPIFQVDEDRGVPFIAMPFLKGSTLEEWIHIKQKSGAPITVANILKLGREMAKGLSAAHEHGLIHRDIKPANIWLDSTVGGRVKILDFGLARLSNSNGNEQNLTQSGMIMGTPAYMAPEQAQGKKDLIDGRTDLFSLGCILYRLCTGNPPFLGDDMISTLVAVAMENPTPPSAVNGEIPQALSDLVMKLLEKKSEDRPASAKEVVKIIQQMEKDLAAGTLKPASATAPMPKAMPKPAVAQSIAVSELPSITAEVPQPPTMRKRKRAKSKKRRNNLVFLIGGGVLGIAALIVAGIIVFWETPKGTVRVEINDPGIQAAIDKDDFNIKGADKHDIRLKPGDHGLRVKLGDLEFETDKFVLKKGDTVTLKIDLLPGKVQVVQDGKVIGEKRRPSVPDAGEASLEKSTADAFLAKAPFDARQAQAYQEAWAKRLGVPVEITNSVGMTMRLIPPGEFEMGTPHEALKPFLDPSIAGKLIDWEVSQLNAEGVPHLVRLTRPYYMGVHEVTRRQFRKFVTAQNYQTEVERNGLGGYAYFEGQWVRRKVHTWAAPGGWVAGEDEPVVHITPQDAQEFCDWLSRVEGRKCALPTEAQWEFACRAGTTGFYQGGDEKSLAEIAWTRGNSNGGAHSVGVKKPNAFGLFDMLGNAWETCADWYSPGATTSELRIDPVGPATGEFHVIRGGSWYRPGPPYARSAFRGKTPPAGVSDAGMGFRVAVVGETGLSQSPKPATQLNATPKPDWGTFIDPSHDCQVSTKSDLAMFSIPKGVHDLGAQGTGAPRLLQDFDGDFTMDVKVASIKCAAELNQWASGGLLIWKDEKNFIRLERAQRISDGQLREFCFLYAYRDGKPYLDPTTQQAVANRADLASPRTSTHLRLERRQGKFYPSLSEDGGKTWKAHPYGSFAMDFPARSKVGVAAVGLTGQPVIVQFEDFRITHSRAVKDYGDVIDPIGDSQISTEGNKLIIQIPGEYRDLQPNGTAKSPRVLQEVNGDFVAQVKIANSPKADAATWIPAHAGGAFRSGGLLIWKDDKTFFRFERVSREVQGKVLPLCWLEAYQDGVGAMDAATKARVSSNREVPDQITLLRVERKQDVFHLSYSQDDGKTWVPHGSGSFKSNLPAKLNVGVSVVNNTTQPLRVEFEDFQIIRYAPPPAGGASDTQVNPPKPLPPPPDLAKAILLYEDKFSNPKSGWGIGKQDYYDVGYANGKYFVGVTPGGLRDQYCPKGPFPEFACTVIGRVTGSPAGAWLLMLRHKDTGREYRFAINGKQEIEVSMLEDAGKKRTPIISWTRHPAIKPGEEFNKLLVIVRNQQFELYVNEVMLCEPIATDKSALPATLLLCGQSRNDVPVRAEFQRITIQSAQGMISFEQRRDKMSPPQ